MARITKRAYKTFQENITVARGIVKLHFFIEDLVEKGGKNTWGKLLKIQKKMMGVLGLRMKTMEKLIAPSIERHLKKRLERVGEEEAARRAEQAVKDLEPEFRRFFEDVLLVFKTYRRGLLPQAVVATVSALEVYVSDVTLEAVEKSPAVERRFYNQLQEGLKYDNIKRASGNLRQALAEVVADSYTFYDVLSLRRHMSLLLGGATPLDSKAEQERLAELFRYRHLIAHNAGIVDETFKRHTGTRYRLGEPLELRRKDVEAAVEFIEGLVKIIQSRLEKTSGRERSGQQT